MKAANLARLEQQANVGNSQQKQFGPFVIDVQERVLQRDGQPVSLTPKAFDLLAALIDQPGRLLSKDELLELVWAGTFVAESNLTYTVFALRKVLGDTADQAVYIETVPKHGYRFVAKVTTVATPAEPAVSSGTNPTSSPNHKQIKGWIAASLAAVAAVVTAGYLATPSQPGPEATDPLRAVPLHSLPGVVRSPSLSPDGTYVVFTWNGPKQDNPDIYIQQIGAGPPQRLTSDPGNDYSPSWSPDGRMIAFLRRPVEGGASAIWRIAPLGGREQRIATVQPRLAFFRPMSLSWCPDATCVLTTDSTGPAHPDAVFAIAVDSGDRRQLTYPAGLALDADPVLSPDGRTLLFRRDRDPFSGEFYRQALTPDRRADGAPARLTGQLAAGRPRWLPGGREFLFATRGGLWRLDAFSGGKPARLPFVGQDGLSPVVAQTADGRQRLVYVHSFADTNVRRIDTASPGAPAASSSTAAIASTRIDQLPNLSPDGRHVVFLSDRSGDAEFWVADPDGSNPMQLTSLGILPGFARWSPDGSLIAFHGNPHGRPDVLLMAAGGGEPKVVTKGNLAGAYPSFSRDGRWLYFSAGLEQGRNHIWKMPVAGGPAIQVTSNSGSIAIESYAGDLYYVDAVDRPGTLWRLAREGGAAVKVLEGIASGNFDVVDRGIYYIERVARDAAVFLTDRPGGDTQLQFFDFTTRRTTSVARNLGTISLGLSASRDGRIILYSRIESSIDELMVVDDFR